MHYLIRVFLFNVFGLWLTRELLPFFVINGNWQTILSAAAVLSLLMLLVQPLLKILFIPINIITFGLLSWLINVIVLFLLTVFVDEVTITDWSFPGWYWSGFSLPAGHISYPLAMVIASLTITLLTNFLHDVSEK